MSPAAQPQTVGVADASSLWPGGIVYYDDGGCIAASTCPNLAQAVSTFNTDFSGVVQWMARASQATYVVITLSGTGGRGDVNSIGYPQQAGPIALNCDSDCSVTTLLHEMGHIVGLYHEQTRTDRDSYVTMYFDNVVKSTWPGNFAINTQNQQLLTPYDYASVMQYPAFVDSRNGGPVIETIPAGIPMQGTEGVPGAGNQDYSAADKEAIERLYGKAPTAVTVTSNPIGLQVIVDGQTVTTPQTYSWALNSTHTLSVAAGVQTLTGLIENSSVSTTFYYTYGRWNNSSAQSQTITVSPGNGSPAFPRTSPQIATYSANFIQLVPYTETVTPSGDGTVSVSPAAQSYPNESGSFFVARQNVTLTATPGSGVNFYEFNAQYPYFWLPGGLSANPKEFYVPDTGNPVAVSAEFTSYPVYTVSVAPPGGDAIANAFSDNVWAFIDGAYWLTPRNFSADPAYSYDTVTSWAPGTSHTLNVNSGAPEYPYSSNSRFAFSSWSDGGAEQHSISSLPAVSTAYTATVTPQYQSATNFGYPPCGGGANISPNSPTGDGFYPWGTQLTFTATPNAGADWGFGGWSYDLTGNANPASLTADDETLVYANFNTNTATGPLTLTGLSPASVPAGSSGFTLTLTGSGFTSGTQVYVGSNSASPVNAVSSTEIQVPISAAWVASAGNFDVSVENYPTGWDGCAVFGYDTFTVTGALITPTVKVSPASSSITTAQPEQVTITVSGGTGNPTPTGVVGLSSTPYNSFPVPLSGGVAIITIPAGQLAVGSDTLTAIYGGDETYSTASATAPVTVTQSTSCSTGNPNLNPNPAASTVPSDFNGDCKSDILWRNSSSGQAYTWFMNGTALSSSSSSGTAASPWAIQGIGDFDGDGKADILWRNTSTGQVYIWLMNGSTLVSAASPGTVATAWVIKGVGDFDGDGKSDILWQNSSTGQVYVWLMNGTAFASSASPGTVGSPWAIKGVGDFNGDGKADILWQSTTTGQVYVWLMNGTALSSSGTPGTAAAPWTIEGVGDFNDDGKADILWQNSSTGQVYIWLINGTALASAASPGTVGSPWTIKGVADYNGDGKADILWQSSSTGQVYVWLMNGTALSSSGTPGTAAAPWQIITP